MKRTAIFQAFAASLLIHGLVMLCAAQNSAGQGTTNRQAELVQFGDVIDVDVLGGFEFDWRGTITPEGYLNGFEGYGDPIFALCRNETQIADDIAKTLSKILREPKVVVKVIDRSGRAQARIDGAVKTPTRFRIMRPVHLRELIVMAGGLTDDTSGAIQVFRPQGISCASPPAAGAQDNGGIRLNIKISDLLSGKPDADPEILSGDQITIERAMPVYVIGAVANPGPLYTRGEMRLTAALASAGGMTRDADGGQISIFRKAGADVSTIAVDISKVKAGEVNDELLKPFDIIDVASKGGSKRKFPPVSIADDRTKREAPLKIVD